MAGEKALRIAIVAGEESGDLLGADIVRALERATGRKIQLLGIGGRHLQELGLAPLFNGSDIALMGFSAVLRDLPRLMRRISQTAATIAAERPDCLITIDSPDFSLRVAKKVRAANPAIPIVHYVCPSVWAWRPGRAVAMKPYVDHILCILPFEVKALAALGGPPGTYVGHRLTRDQGVLGAAKAQAAPRDLSADRVKTLLVLPGSRRGEVRRLLEPFGKTISVLHQRGHRLRLLLPTVPHVAELVRASIATWDEKPEIITDAERKWQAFGKADAALIASGTVSLELALCSVPMISTYKVDPIARQLLPHLITTWSALLPNLISDRVLVPEFYNQFVRPENLARQLEALFADSGMRAWQKAGFAEIARRMATEKPSGELAAEVVLECIKRKW
ncbi:MULTISPECIES: lipid-A-disaccharide synthase [unclassified Mesorhizobium]|uniref:lipid-A-disaccharide synthase n=1 Tax=unclassified Mesorhizobium TaxID=325217 RepID=UPI000BAFEB9A|nr:MULTISPECIES: lipid-A-disaccharide synthase [unclassified Mesorhizobium]TGT59875.1 lipid-A-disaccharide synthase [Mesorhizobium sp. M00.F.Ca.ET.170.01.1.1]AZO08031.1 lipid-A-disaccharide synthase [Mesorhizobium sp. M3A.F.Ca.ET.080.04.2.1]PBB87018.1 lipid-A-disaccharide synthase [Mesorhizobium sp. WSM3876]RWB70310.1 MAG: lipid-A-disaccharide synthase [Mesorhizobium sp.]RWB91373.1 MAG: lipid-A-disaccharide synthase [Mesorhizobium sp.]